MYIAIGRAVLPAPARRDIHCLGPGRGLFQSPEIVFIVADDLGETADLAQRRRRKRDELATHLDAWLEERDTPTSTNRNPAYPNEQPSIDVDTPVSF